MNRSLALLTLFLFSTPFLLRIQAQPDPCPGPSPCNPVNVPYTYEGTIDAEKLGITQINSPFGIATTPDGKIVTAEYVSNPRIIIQNPDRSVYKIIKYESLGISDYIFSLTVDKNGFIYAGGFGQVNVFDSQGAYVRTFGSYGSEPGQFTYAWNLAVDASGKIYVHDPYLPNSLQVFNNDGSFLESTSNFGSVYALAATPGGDLLILDNTGFVTQYHEGSSVGVVGQVAAPDYYTSLAMDSNSQLYIHTYEYDGINYTMKLNIFVSGIFLQSMTTIGGEFAYSKIAVNESGFLYISNLYKNQVLSIYLPTGQIVEFTEHDKPGTLYYPQYVSSDPSGNVVVVDKVSPGQRVQVFNYKGDFIRQINHSSSYDVEVVSDTEGNTYLWSVGGNVYRYNIIGELAYVYSFSGVDVAVDANKLYLLTTGENLFSIYSKDEVLLATIPDNKPELGNPLFIDLAPNGNIIIARGTEIELFSNDGTYIKSLSIAATKMHVDSYGNIYVTDSNIIWIYDSEGNLIQEIAYGNGENQVQYVFDMTTNNGRLYVTELYNNRIKVFSNIPSLQVADKEFNYKDWYHFMPESAGNSYIFYTVKVGTAASLSFGSMLTFDNAGEVTIEASVDASLTIRKSAVEFKVTVAKAKLSLVAQNKERVYGEANPGFSLQAPNYAALIDGLRGDDELTEIDELPVITTEASETSPVGDYVISFTGGSDNNYEFEFTNSTLTITKAQLQLLADEKTRQYGDVNPEFTYQVIGLKNDDAIDDLDYAPQLSTTATLTSPADTYPITIDVGIDNNYFIQTGSSVLTVTKALLQVRAQNATRAYGEPNPTFTVTFEGFKNDDTQDILTSAPVPYSEAVINSPVGQYPILFGNNSDARYEYTTTNGVLTIAKANQQITFNDLPSPIDSDADPFSVLSYTSISSNLPITFSIASGPATINGSQVTLTGLGGTVTVQATQPGNSNYNAAEPVSKSFDVNLITGTDEEPGSLRVYPNPTKDALWISSVEGIKFQLLNIGGVPVAQYTNSFMVDHVISTESLPKGIYLLVLQTASGNKTTRKISVVK
jgi:hypothetical protein